MPPSVCHHHYPTWVAPPLTVHKDSGGKVLKNKNLLLRCSSSNQDIIKPIYCLRRADLILWTFYISIKLCSGYLSQKTVCISCTFFSLHGWRRPVLLSSCSYLKWIVPMEADDERIPSEAMESFGRGRPRKEQWHSIHCSFLMKWELGKLKIIRMILLSSLQFPLPLGVCLIMRVFWKGPPWWAEKWKRSTWSGWGGVRRVDGKDARGDRQQQQRVYDNQVQIEHKNRHFLSLLRVSSGEAAARLLRQKLSRADNSF